MNTEQQERQDRQDRLDQQSKAKHPTTHSQPQPQPAASVTQWAADNNVNLDAITPVFNGIVDDIVSLDTLVQGIPTPLTDEQTSEAQRREIGAVSGAGMSDADRQKVLSNIDKPYGVVNGPAYTANVLSHIRALQQASRNLRTKVQALRVGPVRG